MVKRLTAIAGCALVVLYPVFIYFGLNLFDPRWLSLVLIAAVGLRCLGPRLPQPFLLAFAVALFTTCSLTLLSGAEWGLFIYPVLVNGLLCVLFVTSLWRGPSVIETLARLSEPDLAPSGVAYTRKVTWVWALFFALNGTIAAMTITLGREWWALYNGFIAYLLMALLFSAEWWVRRRVREHHHGFR